MKTIPDIEKEYNRLKTQWTDGTKFHSFPWTIMSHPACRLLVNMGKDIIPFILRDIESGDYWIGLQWLLEEITGHNPNMGDSVIEDGFVKADVKYYANVWIKWGKKKGYLE